MIGHLGKAYSNLFVYLLLSFNTQNLSIYPTSDLKIKNIKCSISVDIFLYLLRLSQIPKLYLYDIVNGFFCKFISVQTFKYTPEKMEKAHKNSETLMNSDCKKFFQGETSHFTFCQKLLNYLCN